MLCEVSLVLLLSFLSRGISGGGLQSYLIHCHWPRQSCLSHAKAPSSLWHGFSILHLQSLLVFAFLSFHLEDIFYYSHTQDGKASRLSCFVPAYLSHSTVSKLFERIILCCLLFFLESNSILSPRQAVSVLDGLHLIKFCTFLSPFRMVLTNPGRALGRSCLLSISPKLLTLSGILPVSTNSFRLASLHALLDGLNRFSQISAPVWSIKITTVAPFESVEVFHKDPFLALYFSLSLLMIFRPLCLFPTAALFTLTIWPFGPPPRRSPLR